MGYVTITHPFHPLCGQQVELVRIRRGNDPDLVVRLPDGLHAAISMSSTNYAAPQELGPPSEAPPLLCPEGLRQARHLADRLLAKNASPAARPEPETNATKEG